MRKFTATEYLKIDIANSFGLDKEDWDIRLQWFGNHKDQLHSLVKKAEEPAQFYAGVLAYEAALRNEPVGYIAKLDATASGIQILTCLIGCEQSAFHVNLTNASRQDAYTNNNRAINTKVSSGVVIERKDSKQALMTNMYGSEAVPKRVFGEDTPELAAFYEATEEQLPGVVKLNAILMGLWNPTALAHKWTLPDGFEVVVKVMNKVEVQVPFMSSTYACPVNVNAPKEKSKSLPANATHSIDGMVVREMNHRCNYDVNQVALLKELLKVPFYPPIVPAHKKDQELVRLLMLADMSGFFSARIIDYIDSNNIGLLNTNHLTKLEALLNTLEKSFEILAVHDCFGFHPNNGNYVRQHYINILAEIADADLLNFIATQLVGRQTKIQRKSISHLIRQSEYPLS